MVSSARFDFPYGKNWVFEEGSAKNEPTPSHPLVGATGRTKSRADTLIFNRYLKNLKT